MPLYLIPSLILLNDLKFGFINEPSLQVLKLKSMRLSSLSKRATHFIVLRRFANIIVSKGYKL